MISVHFKGKPFNIMVIQVYAPTSNTEEADIEWFYEDPQDLLELTPKKEASIPHSKVRCFLFSIFIIIFTAALLGHLSLSNYLFLSSWQECVLFNSRVFKSFLCEPMINIVLRT